MATKRKWWQIFLGPGDLMQAHEPEPEEEYLEPDPARCSHDHMVVANARITQEDGMAVYVNMLIECAQCKDIWRLQHRVNEIAQITGAGDRFLAPDELGLEVREEGGRLTKTDQVKETMRILRENNIRLPRKRASKPRRKK